MYNAEKFAAAIEKVVALFDRVNRKYIEKVAAQIKRIGELNPTSINRLIIFREMSQNVVEIQRDLAETTNLGISGMAQVYQMALDDPYTDPRFTSFVEAKTIPPETNERLTQYAQAVARQSYDTVANLSNTTAISTSYHAAIDQAVTAVTLGLDSYTSATRDIIRDVGANGIPVVYESGYHRRLDTAVRQNITNAAKQIAQQSAIMMGEDLGFDAYEISAHLRSAPDHEPVQGHVLLKAEFERMQTGADFYDIDGHRYAGFRRPIGEWNCGHAISPFSTQHSKRLYTDQQLADFALANKKGCSINGKHYSVYEAGQLMRKIETQIRREKDVAVAAKAAGDDKLRQECQKKINALSAQYSAVARASGIREDRQRMTVEGFSAVKVKQS